MRTRSNSRKYRHIMKEVHITISIYAANIILGRKYTSGTSLMPIYIVWNMCCTLVPLFVPFHSLCAVKWCHCILPGKIVVLFVE